MALTLELGDESERKGSSCRGVRWEMVAVSARARFHFWPRAVQMVARARAFLHASTPDVRRIERSVERIVGKRGSERGGAAVDDDDGDGHDDDEDDDDDDDDEDEDEDERGVSRATHTRGGGVCGRYGRTKGLFAPLGGLERLCHPTKPCCFA